MIENEVIQGCVRNDRNSQKTLYEKLYHKMLGVCLRYAKDSDQAQDILHDGFMKVFAKVKDFNNKGSFEGWVRRIMVNTAIDHLRKNKQEYAIVSTVYARQKQDERDVDVKEHDLLDFISKEDVLAAVQKLSPAYRTVFNLFAIEKYSHKEIADMLGISEGTSKSNFSKAKFNLRKLLTHLIPDAYGRQ